MELGKADLVFTINKSFKGIMVFFLLFFGGGLLVSLIMPFFEPALIRMWWIWIPVIIGYCIFVKMGIDAWRQRNNYVIVNDDSISIHSPENQIGIIKWNEISEIIENNILERLIIKDKYQEIIKLEYQLEKISELLNIIAQKTPHLNEHYSKLEKFRRTKHLHLFFGLSLLFMSSITVYIWYSGSLLMAIILGVFSFLIVYVLLIEFIAVRVNLYKIA